MTKAELIKLLEEYSDDTRIVISGYESGVNDLGSIELGQIALDVSTSGYYYNGRHVWVDSDYTHEKYSDYTIVSAIYLGD